MNLERLLTDRVLMRKLFYIGFVAGLVFIAVGAVIIILRVLG
ncbi:MAG: hypothetical protein QXU73_04210 [Thermoplasmata archaeon]